ncbi:MAG: hypothetical protein Q3972_03830, partial [Corynebacterium sp.]|nr:hypothetical protein [Corynebacterium sp.]
MKTTSWAQPWALALCTSAITLASVVVAPAQTTLAQNNLAFASTGTDAVTIVSNRVDLSKAIASVKVEDNNNGLTLVPQLVSDPSNTGQKLLGWNFSISRVLQRSAASFGIIYTSGLVNWLDGTNGIGAFNVRPQQTYNDGIGVVLSASDSATQNISSTGTKATGQDTYFISGATVTAYGDKSTKFLRWSNDNVGKLWADAEWLNVGNDGHYTIGFDGATQLTKDANIWVAAKVPALRDNIPATNDMVDLAGPAFAAAKNAFIWTIENLTMQDANSPWAGQLYAYAQTLADNATDTQALADYAVDVENILNENKSYKLRNPQAIVAALNLFATPETVAGVSSAARTSADFLADARAQLASARKASSADDTLAYTSSIADSATTASNRIRTTSDALYAAQAWRAATAAYVIAASRYVAADADDKAQDALANVTTTAANAKQYLKRVTDSTDATADERTAAQDTLDAINRMSAMTVDSIRAYQAQQGTGAGTGSNTDTDGGADTGSTGSNTETDPNADGGTKGTGTGDNTGTAGDGQGSGAGDNSGTNTGTKTDTDPNVDTDAGVKGSGSGTGSGTDSGSGSGSGSDS